MEKTVSVAMTSYNGEKYIGEQIDSILEQTYANFELVICDDRSSDSTWEIIQKYAQKDCRIRCYRNEQNSGVVKNFEKAVSLCKGEYIALSDQDDIWEKNHIEFLLSLIKENMLCCGNAALMDSSGKAMDITLADIYGDLLLLDNNYKKTIRILYGGNTFQGASMLMNKKFKELALPIPDDIRFHDVWFAILACGMDSFVFSDKIITRYRQHENSVTKRKRINFISSVRCFSLEYNVLKDRAIYCDEVLKKDITDPQRDLFLTAKNYYKNISSRLFRFKFFSKWYRNYNYMYLSDKKKNIPMFIVRSIKYLFF